MNARTAKATKRFYDKVASRGGKCLTPFVRCGQKVFIQCENPDHPSFESTPNNNNMYTNGWCRWCLGTRPEQLEMEFRQYVSERGGIVVGKYEAACKKVAVKCIENHEWEVCLSDMRRNYWYVY